MLISKVLRYLVPFHNVIIEAPGFDSGQAVPNFLNQVVRCLTAESHLKVNLHFGYEQGFFNFIQIQLQPAEFIGQGQFVVQDQVSPAGE